MFDNLTGRLSGALRKITGKAALTPENIEETLGEVRRALLEADAALPVAEEFLGAVRRRAIGREVSGSLSPGQAFIKIVQAELTALMGEANAALNLRAAPPAVILLAGLQGAGKTTTAAKLARRLRTGDGGADAGGKSSGMPGGKGGGKSGGKSGAQSKSKPKKVMVVSADVHRPAAIRQLQVLAGEAGAEFFESTPDQAPAKIADAALREAKRRQMDVLLVDTAGRLAIDQPMMDEIKQLHKRLQPVETLFVVDAMAGQDAANAARAFNDALPLTGVVLAKADADARGGAALSVRTVTGKPIKFLGVGEKTDALEPFHPDRLASRILGMGDVQTLIEEADRSIGRDKARRLARKVKKGRPFDLVDFREQLRQIKSMGGIAGVVGKLPGMSGMAEAAERNADPKQFARMEAMIDSMTPRERRRPDLIQGSRKRRIAAGSGTAIPDLNRLLKQHKQMQKMMKKAKSGKMDNIMRGISGNMPPGGMPPGMR